MNLNYKLLLSLTIITFSGSVFASQQNDGKQSPALTDQEETVSVKENDFAKAHKAFPTLSGTKTAAQDAANAVAQKRIALVNGSQAASKRVLTKVNANKRTAVAVVAVAAAASYVAYKTGAVAKAKSTFSYLMGTDLAGKIAKLEKAIEAATNELKLANMSDEESKAANIKVHELKQQLADLKAQLATEKSTDDAQADSDDAL